MNQVFIDNPALDVAYQTADGYYFYTEGDAKRHAQRLTDKAVEKRCRPTDTPSENPSQGTKGDQSPAVAPPYQSEGAASQSMESARSALTENPSEDAAEEPFKPSKPKKK